jgi:hypothetical protein
MLVSPSGLAMLGATALRRIAVAQFAVAALICRSRFCAPSITEARFANIFRSVSYGILLAAITCVEPDPSQSARRAPRLLEVATPRVRAKHYSPRKEEALCRLDPPFHSFSPAAARANAGRR